MTPEPVKRHPVGAGHGILKCSYSPTAWPLWRPRVCGRGQGTIEGLKAFDAAATPAAGRGRSDCPASTAACSLGRLQCRAPRPPWRRMGGTSG
ncbi:MAG TPA: hypothetical protein VGX23_26745 [Actinocrinis sp.]|nr:hypothetical protein [Actinocrinis sp.]